MELSFWGQYGITPDILKTYRVLSSKEFKSENGEGKPFAIHSTDSEPMFGYQGKRHVKIYRPKSEIRFLYGGLLPYSYCFGLEQLPSRDDTLFITGGEKDVMSLAAHGFHAICFNSETGSIPQNLIKKLSFHFKHIVLLYDADKTGVDLLSNTHSNSLIRALNGLSCRLRGRNRRRIFRITLKWEIPAKNSFHYSLNF
jgi:hypothetical protein